MKSLCLLMIFHDEEFNCDGELSELTIQIIEVLNKMLLLYLKVRRDYSDLLIYRP